MSRANVVLVAGALLALVGMGAWTSWDADSIPEPLSVPEPNPVPSDSIVVPIPTDLAFDPQKASLGSKLFHDPILSKDRTVSCASCHDLASGGDDGRPTSIGVDGARGVRNAPTVLNARFAFRQFWDGRAMSLEEQLDGPINHPDEMASSWELVVERLRGEASYVTEFATLYADGITEQTVRNALCEFERSLFTPNSRFDRFLAGEPNALTQVERDGWTLFQDIGCVTCHQGVNLGSNSFQPFGVMGNYFADRQIANPDPGRFGVTGKERDRHRFKVPTLRNVARTAPYFHDGSTASLDDAVRIMARYQLGFDLEPDEVTKIVAFLKTLDGEVPRR